jgi:hypothetical protein
MNYLAALVTEVGLGVTLVACLAWLFDGGKGDHR